MLFLVPNFGVGHSNLSGSPYVSSISSLEDPEHLITIEDIAADDKIISTLSSNPTSFGHTTATLWIKAVLKNPSPITRWSVNISNRHFTPVEIYQKSDTALQRIYLNAGEILYNTPYQPVSATALIDVPVSGETVLYFKLRSLKTTFFLLTFNTPEQAYRAHQKGLAVIYICIGLLLSLVFVNLMMYFSLRKSYLVLYSLQEAFIIILIVVESGLGINYLWVGNSYINNSASIISLLGLIFSAAVYTRSFFNTKHSPVIDKILVSQAVLALLCIALSSVEPFRTYLLQGGLPVAFILSIAIMFCIGLIKLKRGKTYALPYFLSTSLVIVFIIPMMYAIFSQSLSIFLLVIETIALLCVSEAIMLCIAVNMRLDSMRTKHNIFNQLWIETLKERLAEVSRFSQLTEEKNIAVEGSQSSIKRLSNTSHDIQHSLYSIRLHLEIIRGTEQFEGTVGKIEDGLGFISNITQKLIDDGINLITTESELVDFDQLFSCVIDQTSPLVKNTGVSLVYSCSNLRHPGSAVIIRRLLENLVRNALRHTDSGEVRLNIVHRCDNLVLSVSDTGKGMNARVVRNLIEVTRSDDIEAIENSGYGLGLSIVSALCQQAGYKIEIESALNRGTTVSILIPIFKSKQLTV
ncbi:MAG: sensor histidine kinase [Pseudomonadales bacterium]|nr:sensor histidine kinase [Pseudomonadales bacterium]NRA16871.1 sensor histidine kinase [Oceanospirillaceae bacterium]